MCKSPLFLRDQSCKGSLYGNPSWSYFTLKLQNLQRALNATTVWQQFVTGGIFLVSTKCLRRWVVAHTSLVQSKVRIDTNDQALPLTHFHFISQMNIHNGSSVVCHINDPNAICQLPKLPRIWQDFSNTYRRIPSIRPVFHRFVHWCGGWSWQRADMCHPYLP